MPPATKKEDTIRLLSKLQLLDISDIAVRCTRERLLLVLAKSELIELDGEGDESRIGRKQAEELLETSVQEGDALRGSWPWDEKSSTTDLQPSMASNQRSIREFTLMEATCARNYLVNCAVLQNGW